MTAKLRDLFIGKPLSDDQLSGEKFRVLWGLPIYSSDTISSVAYAGEEVLVVLLPVLGLMATHTLVYVMCAIIALLLILVFCYRQTIDAYPQGGGAYIVGADNLGEIPGLVAASSLTVGYILTVAVSSCSGAAAVVSAFPALGAYKAWIAFAIVCLLTWGNLRGMRESAVMFGVPTYFFILSILVLIITGFVRAELGYEPPAPAAVAETAGDVTLLLLLRAFASGCTALTGVEAVSNGVPSFCEPSAKNAKLVLSLMAAIVGVTFISVAVLTDIYHVVPENGMTAIACLAAAVFGSGSVWFHIFQIATVVILSLAANTAYAGMPLLLAMVAHDGYMPRRYTQRGARLNFSNGVLLIFFSASALIFLFNADTHTLLPLYATGVFVSFTISQAGMFVRWTKTYTLMRYKQVCAIWKIRYLKKERIREIISFSMLTCIQQSVMNLGILMVQGLVNSFGTVVMAAFAAAVKIDAFAYMPVQDFGNAFSTFIAQNYGAKEKKRIQQGLKAAVYISAIFCVVVSAFVYIFAKPLMMIFVDAKETAIIMEGVRYLRIEGAFYIGIGWLFLLYGLYRALGRPGMSVVLTVFSLGTRVALAYILSAIPAIGVVGIWWSIPIGWALADIVGLLYYKIKKQNLVEKEPEM